MKKQNKMDLSNEREVSLRIFTNAIDNNYQLSDELTFFEKNFQVEKSKINFAYEITEGLLKNLILIDEYINILTKNKKLDTNILNIIRLGIYQILFTNSPEFASVNESVNLAKKYSHEGGVKFVNAILRNFLRKKDELSKIIDGYEFYKRISIKNSIPSWIIDYWKTFINKDELEALAYSMNEKPVLYLRINTLKVEIDAFKSLLLENEIKYSETNLNDVLKIEQKISVKEIKGYEDGFFYIQDLAAASIAHILNPKENDIILDFCSFPGGKTSHISQLMNNKGKIYAIDSNKNREKVFIENISKLGCKNIETLITNAEEPFIKNIMADKILVDPPCSGLGVMRKKPEIRYRRKKEDILRLVDIQNKILENASNYLKIGGELVYSTCTISKEENEKVITNFLENNKNFKLEKIFIEKEFVSFFPSIDKTDGFFVAKIKRIL
ncbi:MAG: 16S rRNA (cytosine(967)-C(5))-methyltransferase RsmB [Cyanobacteriota bacterium]